MMKKFAYLLINISLMLMFKPVLAQNVQVGSDRLDILLPLLENKRVALVVNQTSTLSNGVHLLDTLLSKRVKVNKIFAPEHGFRGDADAGQLLVDGKDSKTGIPVVSLYGKNFKPKKEQLSDVDVVVFDIQDVGTRFFTYISTMHYVMESCAKYGQKCIVLDRPNPNDYIDGPVLNTQFKSFVGMHPIPILHGLTVGELAQMINGEGWLDSKNKLTCDLAVIPMTGWVHGQPYSLPIKPSPNLPNDEAIKLYPSLCFFEATGVSVGRGTEMPFQVLGFPDKNCGEFTFTPKSLLGATNPPQKGNLCYGLDFRNYPFEGGLRLHFLIDFYNRMADKDNFFSNPRFMDLLSGTNQLRLDILKGRSEEEIRLSWADNLNQYKKLRNKYLLYTDTRK